MNSQPRNWNPPPPGDRLSLFWISGASRWRGAVELLLLAALPALLLAARDRGLPPGGRPAATENPPAGAPEPGPANGVVTAEQALAWPARGQGVLWVDARTAAAFAREHVPGAAPLNEDDWSALLPGVLERWGAGERVVVYCDGGDCHASERVAARLRDAGLDPVFVLRGGWPAWQRASGGALPVTTEPAPR